MRSAVSSAAEPLERSRLLHALVETARQPSSTVWWRADLASGQDDGLASELTQIGLAGLAAGDAALAMRALGRAADLSSDVPARVERLLQAADAAGRAGAPLIAWELLDRVDAETDDPRTRARTAWLRELLPVEATALAHGDLRAAASAIDDLRVAGDVDGALDALLHLASIAWDHSTHADPGAIIATAARAFDLDPDEPRALLLAAVTDPVRRSDDVIARIRDRVEIDDDDALGAWYLGYALDLCGEIERRGRLSAARRRTDSARAATACCCRTPSWDSHGSAICRAASPRGARTSTNASRSRSMSPTPGLAAAARLGAGLVRRAGRGCSRP